MTTATGKDLKTRHLDALAARSAKGLPEWVQTLRKESSARFEQLAFPDRHQEEWRFTNVTPILEAQLNPLFNGSDAALAPGDVEPFLYGEKGWTELVFVDGHYSDQLSNIPGNAPDITTMSLRSALEEDHPALKTHLNRYAANGTSTAFTALNAAALADGAFVYISRGKRREGVVHVVFISTAAAHGGVTCPRNLVVLEDGSELALVESYVHLGTSEVYWTNAVTELVLGEGAILHRTKIVQEGPRGFHLATAKAHQARDSRLDSFVFTFDGHIVRNEERSTLDGEGAECLLNGLYTLSGDMLVDNATGIDHAQPHGTSWIGYKGILSDQSRGVFSGRIQVRRGAQKTDSKQLNNNLILSEKATIDTKPLLEIFADDVKCTHGATVGPPADEVIYYLQTRGLSPERARGMLTYGFARDIVDRLPNLPVRRRLDRIVFDKYSPR